MRERDVIARLRRIATDPAARNLEDDAALLDGLVLTHDSIAEGIHFLATDPPTLTCIGRLVAGGGLSASDREGDVPLPETLGYEHRASVSPMGGRL